MSHHGSPRNFFFTRRNCELEVEYGTGPRILNTIWAAVDLLAKEADLDSALTTLEEAGHSVRRE